MPPITAVLFDLDGTLVDSLQDIADAVNTILATHGRPKHPLHAYRHFVGEGMTTLVSRVLPAADLQDPDFPLTIEQQTRRLYSDNWYHHSRPYPGIPQLLADLDLRVLRLGVLSNKPDEFTRVMVEHFFPDTPWATLRGARNDTPLKPAPDAALAIAEEWNTPPEHILYVGDTRTDILTARNTGMPSVGVTWGFRDRDELEQSGATSIAEHPRDILSALG